MNWKRTLLCAVRGSPGGSDGRESVCNAGDPGSIPGLGRSPGEGHSNPLQYSCLVISMDRGAWWATVHGVLNLQDYTVISFPGDTSGKEHLCQGRKWKTRGFDPWVRKIPWRRTRQPTPAFLPGESHGQRSLVGYSPRGCKESNMTEWPNNK